MLWEKGVGVVLVHQSSNSASNVFHTVHFTDYKVNMHFRQVFAVSFPEYLNNYRYSAAVEMIRTTDKPLADIAQKSGFQSINSVFLRNMGMTPSQLLNR